MKNRILTISIAVLFLSLFSANAQVLSNKERRHIYSKAISLIEEYEDCAALSNDDAVDEFANLFTNPNVKIVFDLPGAQQYLSDISVSEYINRISEIIVSADVSIIDVKKGELIYDNGDWILPIAFKKDISYVDKNGIAFLMGTDMFPDIDISMNIRYNSRKDICTIDSIQGRSAASPFLKKRFLVVEKSNFNSERKYTQKYLQTLTVDGKPVEFNEFEQAFIPDGKFRVSDPDATVNTVRYNKGDNYDLVSFDIKPPKSGRLKLRFGTTISGAYSVKNNSPVSGSSRAFEVGVDIGKTWPIAPSSKLGIYTGAGFSFSSLDLSLANTLSYEYIDKYEDSDGYYKDNSVFYQIKSAEESMAFKDILVPLYMEMEHRIGNYLAISWNIGAKFYGNLMTSPGEYTASGIVVVGGDAPASFNTRYDRFVSPVSYKRSPYDISAAAGIGIDVNLLNRVLFFSVNFGYEYGITESYTAKGNTYYNYNVESFEEKVFPIVYRDNENIAVHSLIASTSFRRQAMWVGIGIKLKM